MESLTQHARDAAAGHVPFAALEDSYRIRQVARDALMQRLTWQLGEGFVLAQRLEAAREGVLADVTLDLRVADTPTDAEAEALDLFVHRYLRLQDLLAEALFPALLEAGAEVKSDSAFGDKLRVLQRLGIVHSAERWLALRALRNDLAKPEASADLRLESLREAVESVATLVGGLRAASHYARNKLGL